MKGTSCFANFFPFTVAVLGAFTLATVACQPKPRFDYDFEDERVLDQLEWKCRTMYRISPEHATSGAKSLELTLYLASADVEVQRVHCNNVAVLVSC